MNAASLRPLAALAVILNGPLLAAESTTAAEKPEELDEVVVQGKVPGPPMWKISNGERVLWILPLVDVFPKNIDWDSASVEALLAGSEEYLYRPRNGIEFSRISTSPLTILRALSAFDRLKHLPRGQQLSDVLPPELYQRLLALRKKYFRFHKISHLSVWEVRRLLEEQALDEENLAMLDYHEFLSPQPITTKLYKWLNRSRINRRTYTSYFVSTEITAETLKAMSKALATVTVSAAALDREIACLEKSIAYFEKDFAGAKRRANAWASGSADDLLNPGRLHTETDSCRYPPFAELFKGNPRMEQFLHENPALAPDFQELDAKRREHWLAEAERALNSNNKTFAVLTVDDILGKGSLVAVLESRGYGVEVYATRRQ